jgi:hypothetical protein
MQVTEDPRVNLWLFHVSKLPACKIDLLETRNQTLQLLLMKFGLKLNTFESILNLSERGILCITLAYKLSFLRFLVGSIFRPYMSLCKSFKLSIVL